MRRQFNSTEIEFEELTLTRSELASSLGGSYLDHDQVQGAYQAAWHWLQYHPAATSTARDGAAANLEVIDGSCDGGHLVVNLALSLAATYLRSVTFTPRDVLFVGCRAEASREIDRRVTRALQRGAIVVASDRSAELSLLRSVLLTGEPRSPRRARVAIVSDSLTLPRLPLLPAVRLSAGHRPLAEGAQRVSGSTVLARDVLTGEPIATLVPVLSGHLLYSTAHWLQDEPVDAGGIGQRPLFAAPAYADTGRDFPIVSVGEFHAAAAMLSTLVTGVLLAGSPVDDDDLAGGWHSRERKCEARDDAATT